MPKVFTSKTQKIGELGEGIAVKFLMKLGFSIIERNYTRKWGEIDIVAQKDNNLVFFEVKSVSCESLTNVTHVTERMRPEENMHEWKIKRLGRTIETYLAEKGTPESVSWQVDLLIVRIDQTKRQAKVERIEHVI